MFGLFSDVVCRLYGGSLKVPNVPSFSCSHGMLFSSDVLIAVVRSEIRIDPMWIRAWSSIFCFDRKAISGTKTQSVFHILDKERAAHYIPKGMFIE